MSKGSVADQSGKISIGDRLLSVNDKNLEYVTHDDAVSAIASSTKESNEILLTIAKVTKYTTQLVETTTSPPRTPSILNNPSFVTAGAVSNTIASNNGSNQDITMIK